MRRVVFAIIGLGLVAIIVIGISQSVGNNQAASSSNGAPTLAAAQQRLAGSPPQLAALHRQANRLLPGGPSAYHARLRSLRGRPVVVNLWASWCDPCRAEFPIFQRTGPALGKQVAFLGVDVDDSTSAADKFLGEHPVSYPSYTDPNRKVFGALGIQGLPTTAYYDRRGRLAYIHQGPYPSEAALSRDVRRYLGVA